jgi:spore coat polysaccharide biosynthesis protein SpsF
MPRTIAIIQARMGSSRLPGKVLLDICGKPMLQHVLERTQRAQTLDEVVVATTSQPEEAPIADFCASLGVPCTRGSLHDVLDRYYQAARAQRADVIVRITGDCPLIDPILIDQTAGLIAGHPSGAADFACNRLPPPFRRSLPIGLDVEVCTFTALERAWGEATELFQREHVMPYLYEGVGLAPGAGGQASESWWLASGISPRGFRIVQLNHNPDYGSLRWTVDTPADLAFAREVVARLGGRPGFTWQDVLALIQEQPALAEINAEVRHKHMNEVDERGT